MDLGSSGKDLCSQRRSTDGIRMQQTAAEADPQAGEVERKETATVADAVAIVAGTSIGGGFLALPTVTSPMGFFPSVFGLTSVWVLLALTGIAYAEAASRAAVDSKSDTAAEAVRSLQQARTSNDDDVEAGVSVVTVTKRALGSKASLLCSLAFVTQMLAVLTAQVVKTGEIFWTVTGLPYVLGCAVPSALVGLFTFRSRARSVEQTNTALALAMVGGFALLVVTTLASAASSGMGNAAARLSFANWTPLLPTTQPNSAWVLPVFINMLCFGQSIPVVVERLGADRPGAIRASVLLGSGIPLLLCVIWAAISTALGDPVPAGGRDPVLTMLTGSFMVAFPVGCIALGAIGTTLIASYLSLSQFGTDAICAVAGACSMRDRSIACMCAVALPALLACVGPGLYLPLLAFAGAFPTTLLYVMMPPLATAVLRRSMNYGGGRANRQILKRMRIVPGGLPTLVSLIAVGVSILSVSTISAIKVRFFT